MTKTTTTKPKKFSVAVTVDYIVTTSASSADEAEKKIVWFVSNKLANYSGTEKFQVQTLGDSMDAPPRALSANRAFSIMSRKDLHPTFLRGLYK